MQLLLKLVFRECHYILMHMFWNQLDICTIEYLYSYHYYNSNKSILFGLLLNINTKNWAKEITSLRKMLNISSSDSSSNHIGIKRPELLNYQITIASWLLYLYNEFSRYLCHFQETRYNNQYLSHMEINSIRIVALIHNYLH